MAIDERYFYGAHGIDIEKARQEPKTDILDKIKHIRTEIENEVKFWSEPSKYNATSAINAKKAKVQSYKHCLELIDELIAESEETE